VAACKIEKLRTGIGRRRALRYIPELEVCRFPCLRLLVGRRLLQSREIFDPGRLQVDYIVYVARTRPCSGCAKRSSDLHEKATSVSAKHEEAENRLKNLGEFRCHAGQCALHSTKMKRKNHLTALHGLRGKCVGSRPRREGIRHAWRLAHSCRCAPASGLPVCKGVDSGSTQCIGRAGPEACSRTKG
jgi:hypothetical protein